jgi:hypothetical protein
MTITNGQVYYQSTPLILMGFPNYGTYDFDGIGAIIYQIHHAIVKTAGNVSRIQLLLPGMSPSPVNISWLSSPTIATANDGESQIKSTPFKCPIQVPAGSTIVWSGTSMDYFIMYFKKVDG